MTRIVVHIDRLVLRGLRDADALSAEILRGVAEALGTQPLQSPLITQGDRARVHVGKVAAAATPEGTGAAIGQRIVSGGTP
jgi:hypothetical protein